MCYLILWFLSEPAELSKLQLDACHFCHSAVRGPARGVGCTFPNVHIGVWDLGWCVKGWHQPRANVFLQRRTIHYRQAVEAEKHKND